MHKGAAILALMVLLSACGSAQAKPSKSAVAASTDWSPVLIDSDLVPGQNRFTLGLLDEQGQPITDASVHLTFFKLLDGGKAQAAGSADAVFMGKDFNDTTGNKGVYVAHPTFDASGQWGLQVDASRGGGPVHTSRTNFQVNDKPTTPAVGSKAIPSHNKIASDVQNLSEIDSGNPPDDMHDLRISDGIAEHKPMLIIFATPAYCVSRVCGPEVQLVQSLEPEWRDKVGFIHIEIYADPKTQRVMQTVEEWRIRTEPWIFLVDRNGIITAKFEGPTLKEELEPELAKIAS